MPFKEYRAEGEFVLGPDGEVRYDGLDPRSARIIAELLTYESILEDEKDARGWKPIETAPPIQRFICGQGLQPSKPPYVLAVDAKGRMSVGYARENSEGFMWVFAKPIGQPTHWMPLPAPPPA